MQKKYDSLSDVCFRRKFSTCLYKNLRLNLGGMEFSQDIIKTDRGDKYPLVFSSGEYSEKTENGMYYFSSDCGCAERLIGHLVPFAVYEADIRELDGGCGFSFIHGDDKAAVYIKKNGTHVSVIFENGERREEVKLKDFTKVKFSVQSRVNKLDVYADFGGFAEYICTFTADGFEKANAEEFFMNTRACVLVTGNALLAEASVFMDSGISQADIRAVRYENGDVMVQDGRVYLTASIRMHEGGCQGVFSWIPGTSEFELTGTLFFDTGDGLWSGDVATCLVFDRNRSRWILWVCSFSHGHILARTQLETDVRFGNNVVDVQLMKSGCTNDTEFAGKKGDEDPALVYDEKTGKWYLAICRVSDDNGSYLYHFFASDSPLDGFEYIGKGKCGSETGGSFVRYNGELYFVCGNGFEITSEYRIYRFGEYGDPVNAEFDYPDGGFRGWGTVIPVTAGTRERLYWLTFDRHRGSDFNWSYGNIYCFEGY